MRHCRQSFNNGENARTFMINWNWDIHVRRIDKSRDYKILCCQTYEKEKNKKDSGLYPRKPFKII